MKAAAEVWCKWMAGMGWQVALLSTAVLAVSWLARKHSPRLRHALWSLVLLKLCLPPSLSFVTGAVNLVPRRHMKALAERLSPASVSRGETPLPRHGAELARAEVEWAEEEESVAGQEATIPPLVSGAASEPSEKWAYLRSALFAVWAAGVAVLAGLVVVRRRRVAILLREAHCIASPLLEETARLLSLRRVELWSCEKGISSPATLGLASPRVLMPANLLRDLSEAELKPVLLHELSHIRRGDLWVNLLQTVLQVAYWFHPFVWLANSRLRREREMVVDDEVLLRIGEARQSYGEALTRIARSASRFPQMAMGLVGIVDRPSALAARLARVSGASYRPTKRISPLSAFLVIVVGALGIPQSRTAAKAEEESAGDRIEFSERAEELPQGLDGEGIPEAEAEHGAGVEEIAEGESGPEARFSQELPDTDRIPAEMEGLSRDINELRREMAEVRELVRRMLED